MLALASAKKDSALKAFYIVFFFLPYSSLALIVIVMDGGGCAWQPFTCFYTWIWLMTWCCVYIFTVCWRSMAYKKDGEEEVCYTVTITLPPCPKTNDKYTLNIILIGAIFTFKILIYIPWAMGMCQTFPFTFPLIFPAMLAAFGYLDRRFFWKSRNAKSFSCTS